MSSSKKIKKEIKFDSLIIRLYEVRQEDKANEAIANIQAFNLQGNWIWTIQPPSFNIFYFDMQLDEELGVLEADSGAGRVYQVDLRDGHIISSELIK